MRIQLVTAALFNKPLQPFDVSQVYTSLFLMISQGTNTVPLRCLSELQTAAKVFLVPIRFVFHNLKVFLSLLRLSGDERILSLLFTALDMMHRNMANKKHNVCDTQWERVGIFFMWNRNKSF